jgi:hypothetical protein
MLASRRSRAPPFCVGRSRAPFRAASAAPARSPALRSTSANATQASPCIAGERSDGGLKAASAVSTKPWTDPQPRHVVLGLGSTRLVLYRRPRRVDPATQRLGSADALVVKESAHLPPHGGRTVP